jgi:hypothetical protein
MTQTSTERRAAEYRSGHFRIDDFGPYPGYHRPGVDWNGWATPAFDRETADRIAADFAAQGEGYTAQYDNTRDAFLFGDPDNDWEDDVFPGFGTTISDTDGLQTVGLYGIGASVWTWEEVTSCLGNVDN